MAGIANLGSELKSSVTSGLLTSINTNRTEYTTVETSSTSGTNGVDLDTTFTLLQKNKSKESAEETQAEPTSKLSKGFDWRARLRPKAGGKEIFYGSNAESILGIIKQSNGLIWQYTPSITYSAGATYSSAQMQGMNYPINTYNQSTVEAFSVSSEFTANDVYEAQYMLAAITFLKVCTKSYFGDIAAAQGRYGTPPPVMLFEYLGDHMFNKVPVVVTNYSFSFADDVDYVPVEWDETMTYMPTVARVDITLQPTYNPTKLRTKFDLEKIKSGEAYKHGFL